MKFEVEKKSLKKGWIIAISTILILGIVLVVKTSFAKYRSVKTIHLASGVVNYTKGDFSIVAMYKNDGDEDTEITTMPNEGYIINQDKSYCTLNGVKDNNVELSTDINGNHEFKGLSKGSKCYLYFDKNDEVKDFIIANQGGSKGKYNSTDTFSGTSSSSDTGIYEMEDDYGTSYYFRGDENKLNNWVQFAGFYWRIIRINGNGTIRMIYSGVADALPSDSNKTGTATQINNTIYPYNHTFDDNAYVGYMMGIPLNGTETEANRTLSNSTSYEEAHTNTYDSDIKKAIESWYITNISNKNDEEGKKYEIHLDTESGFCNDREVDKNANSSSLGDGYRSTYSGYAPLGRLHRNSSWKRSPIPSLKCTNKDRDLFTISSSKIGNKKLTYPVGLITSDELVHAGGFGGSQNTSYYLYTNEYYWTMSPYDGGSYTKVFCVYPDGHLGGCDVHSTKGIRPVINLKSNVSITGTGAETDPYIVS